MARTYKLLPVATAVWPKLNQVDESFGKRTWNTHLKLSDADHREIDAWIKQTVKDAGQKNTVHWPWKTNKKTGEVTLLVTAKEEKKPVILDAMNQPIPADVVIGGGAQLRVRVSPYVYDKPAPGIKLSMTHVQVLSLGGDDLAPGVSPFDVVEGGYVASAAADDADVVPADVEADEEVF